MANRVTIKSIAKDLGISHMTVSRALSDNPNVNTATREMILRRAHALGYVKNAAAKAMRGDGSQIVGLLLPNIINEFYARFANALALACEENALHLIIHLTNDELDLEHRALDRLREVQAMAVLMVPTPNQEGIEAPQSNDLNIIQLVRERSIEGIYSSILIDDRAAIQQAVDHLAQQGHRAIGYIGANSKLSSGRQRLGAFQDGLASSGLPLIEELIHTGSPSFDLGWKNANVLMDNETVTALICGGVEISNGALAALMERGIDPNSEIAFVGYGDPSYYAWVAGGVSTIKLPVNELAERATNLLKNIESPAGNATHTLSALLTIR